MNVLSADEDCDKPPLTWIGIMQRSGKVRDPVWEETGGPRNIGNTCDEWPHSVKSFYDPSRRVLRAFLWHHRQRAHKTDLVTEYSALRKQFEILSAQWRKDTRFLSSLDDKILHPAYQSIIAMGGRAVPWVLADPRDNRGHWFWALHFMSGANPVPEGASVSESRDAWLKWGIAKGFLK